MKQKLFQTVLFFHIIVIIAPLCYIFLPKGSRNKGTDIVVMIALLYYLIILGYVAEHYCLQAAIKLREKMPPFMPKMADAFLIIFVGVFLILELNKIRKRIKHRLLFEFKDPRCLGVEDLDLSERVKFALIKQEGILSLDKLIMILQLSLNVNHKIARGS